MKKILPLCLLAGLAVAQAEDVSNFEAVLETLGGAPTVKTKEVPRARLRILEFANNRLLDVDVTANTPFEWQEISFLLKGCKEDYEQVPGQDVAWLEVFEDVSPTKQEEDAETLTEISAVAAPDDVRLFAGWMFNTFPDASTLDHPKYDVRLLSCLPPEELPTVQGLPEDTSAPGDLPTVQGGDL